MKFQTCPIPPNKLSKFLQKHPLTQYCPCTHIKENTGAHSLLEGICPDGFSTYNSVSWWGWKEARLVINEEELLAMSAKLDTEIIRFRMLHTRWELQRPKREMAFLPMGNIILLNRPFDSQHFSISN